MLILIQEASYVVRFDSNLSLGIQIEHIIDSSIEVTDYQPDEPTEE